MLDVNTITKQLGSLSPSKQREVLILLNELSEAKTRSVAQGDFLSFVKEVWPAFIEGEHHQIMSDAFNRIADGSLKRLIVNMPPRHTKSEFASQEVVRFVTLLDHRIIRNYFQMYL